MQPNVVDVTAKTGQQILGRITSWQTRNGPFNVEHLAGRNPAGDLIVFVWSPQHDWLAVNVSQITGQHLAGGLTSWQTPNGPYNVEHLAGRSPAGDLIVYWWSPQHDWQAVNVSSITGQKLAGDVTSWQTMNGPYLVEHLAGRNPAGDLIVYWWSPQHDWQAVNVSHISGQQVAGDVTSWQTKSGPYNVEHLSGRNPNGDLVVFWWSPQHDWQAIDASNIAGGSAGGRPTSIQLVDPDGNAEILGVRGSRTQLYYYWWKPVTDWQVADLTKITGRQIHNDPEAWTTPSGDHVVEHFAAEGDNHALLVFWFDAEVRREGLVTEKWASIGPRNITCVVMALAVDPANPALVYAGAEYGGVWRTTNGGATWVPTMEKIVNPSISAVAVSRSQPAVVYAGASPGSIGVAAGGTSVTLYRSANHGSSWTARTVTSSLFCRALAVHPTNPDILYFAGEQGLHKSVNGGTAWTTVLSGAIDDVKLDVDAPDTIYAAVAGAGLKKSTDGGASWAAIGAGVTFTVKDDSGTDQPSGLNGSFRTRLAVGEDRRSGKHGTKFVVAKVQGTIATSVDGGATWRVLPGTDHGLDDQNWWDSCVAVCPADEDFIAAGGSGIQFTLDASSANPTWKNNPNDFHVDQQAIEFPLSRPTDFYFANDGVVGLTPNRGASSTKVSDGLVASQCFDVGVSQTPTLVVGGSTYHTGTVRSGRTNFFDWVAIDGPEGGLFEIDPANDLRLFGSPWSQNKIHRSGDGGSSWTNIGVTLDDGTATFVETLAIRPDDATKIYASGFFGRLLFSTNGGDDWHVVMTPSGPLLPDVGSDRGNGAFAFAYSPANGACLYLGTKGGHLWRTTTAATDGAGWAELNPPLVVGNGEVGAIAVSPVSQDVVFVGYQKDGIRNCWRGARQPAGTFTWADAGGTGPETSLPLVPINGLVIDPANAQRVFVATHIGVYVTTDGGATWGPFNDGLPLVRIIDMDLRRPSRMLYVAAFGRGFFRRRI